MRRAIGRHHSERILNKWKLYYYILLSNIRDDEACLRWARYSKGRGSLGCGCMMCANPRHSGWNKGERLTIQERRAEPTRTNWEEEF